MHGRALVSLLAVQVLFGIWPVAAKRTLVHLDPFQLMALRVVLAAALLAVVARALVRQPFPGLRLWRWTALMALLGVIGNQTLFLLGVARTTATNASLLITSIPVFTYAIVVLLGREALGPRRALGIALALAGALYLAGLSGFEAGLQTALGDVMILLNAIAFSAYLVIQKPFTRDHDPLSVTAWVFAAGAVVFLPVGIGSGAAPALAAAPTWVWGWMVFIVVGPSVLTYVLNAVALRHVDASTVAAFIYIQPLVTATLAWWLLQEVPSWRLLPAAAAVFAGVWLVARRHPRTLEGATARA